MTQRYCQVKSVFSGMCRNKSGLQFPVGQSVGVCHPYSCWVIPYYTSNPVKTNRVGFLEVPVIQHTKTLNEFGAKMEWRRSLILIGTFWTDCLQRDHRFNKPWKMSCFICTKREQRWGRYIADSLEKLVVVHLYVCVCMVDVTCLYMRYCCCL